MTLVRFCPSGRPTFDVERPFARVPHRGEMLDHDGATYVVVDVCWLEDGSPLVIAHASDRPRARTARVIGVSLR